MASSPEILADNAQYFADRAALAADDVVGQTALLRAYLLAHGAKRVWSEAEGWQVVGGLAPVDSGAADGRR